MITTKTVFHFIIPVSYLYTYTGGGWASGNKKFNAEIFVLHLKYFVTQKLLVCVAMYFLTMRLHI